MSEQQLVVQLGGRDLRRESALRQRGGAQGVRAVLATGVPGGRMLAQHPVLPHRDDPGGDQVFGRLDREYRVSSAYLTAEIECRGHLLTKEGEATGIDPATLSSGPATRARK
jgi:hypothetical protein